MRMCRGAGKSIGFDLGYLILRLSWNAILKKI
jgi:hypothetical protein